MILKERQGKSRREKTLHLGKKAHRIIFLNSRERLHSNMTKTESAESEYLVLSTIYVLVYKHVAIFF